MNTNTIAATSAYYRSSIPGIGLLRLALGTAERLWPALAVRAATRLFLTPLPLKLLNRRQRWGGEWQTSRWPFEQSSLTVRTLTVAAPTMPVVLLVHGWGGHAGQMHALAQALAQQGMCPLVVEMPGHGHSPGWRSSMPQFARAIEYLCARMAEQERPVGALVAHSLGASAAAYAAARSLAVGKLVLVAPAASAPAYTRMFAQVFGLSERTRAAMQKRIEAAEGALMRHFEPAQSGPRVRLPTLVVHDRGDKVNRFADGEAYVAAIAGARMLASEGLGHRAILADARIVGEIARFLGA